MNKISSSDTLTDFLDEDGPPLVPRSLGKATVSPSILQEEVQEEILEKTPEEAPAKEVIGFWERLKETLGF